MKTIAIVGAGLMAVFLALLADPIIVAFAGEDMAMREIGALSIRLQCIALPIHAWVAVVNMFCNGLGNARGAVTLSTARQGTCFLPILFPMTALWGAYGAASVQAVADVLTLALAIPIILKMKKRVKTTMAEHEAATRLAQAD